LHAVEDRAHEEKREEEREPDGALGVPSAVRTKPRTMTIRVKLVMSSTIDGATESSVITITICTATLTWPV